MGRKTLIIFLLIIYYIFSGALTGQVRAEIIVRPDDTYFRPKNPSFNSFSIKQTHPRIFLTPNQRINTTDVDYLKLKTFVDRMVYNYSLGTVNQWISAGSGNDVINIVLNTSLVAITESNNSAYLASAKNWVMYVVNNIAVSQGDDIRQRDRLFALSVAYDWLYPYFTPQQRGQISNRIIEYLDYLDLTYHFFSQPDYVRGHSRYGNIVGFAAALALYGENTKANKYCNQIFYNWIGNIKGYQHTLDLTGREGGHYFGWRYGPGYATPEFAWMWFSSTGKMIGGEWYNQVPYFYIYGTDPYSIQKDSSGNPLNRGTLPSIGDCFDLQLGSEDASILSFSAGYFRNGLAEWYYKKYLSNLYEGSMLFRVLGKAMGVPTPISPSQLPLARFFPSIGIGIARNTWKDVNNPSTYPTILIFKSTPYFVGNHDHLDRNSFTLNFRGPLLIDSGSYQSNISKDDATSDDYGSTYWKNYYTQTIAHNSLVFDGYIGQTPDTNNSITPTSTDGIKNHSRTLSPDGIWMQGDATNAYASSFSSGKPVSKYLRDILMAYNPLGLRNSVILVVDRVSMTESHIPKTIWHVMDYPILSINSTQENNNYGGSAQVKNSYGGYARLDFFADSGINITANPNSITPVAYKIPTNPKPGGQNGLQGWGQIEVSMKTAVSNARFATLIAVNDSSSSLPMAKYVSSDNWVGVNINNSLLIIADSRSQLSNITLNPVGMDIHEIYIAGLKNGPCRITVGSQTFDFVVSDGFYHLQF